jgi:uncharacterized membrane protein YhdT
MPKYPEKLTFFIKMSDKTIQYEHQVSKANPYREISAVYTLLTTSVSLILIISLLIVIYKYYQGKKKTDLVLCTILLWFDLSCASISFINSICCLFNYSNFLGTISLCNLNAIIVYGSFTAAINLMGIISLERCLLIVFKKEYSSRFYYSIVLLYLLINIIIAILTSVTNGFDILPNALYCMFAPSITGGLIGSVLDGLSCGSAYFLIVASYLAICVSRRNQSQKAQLELGLDPAKVKKEVNQTILRSLLIIIASLFTSGIYISILMVSWFYPPVLTNVTDMIQVVFIEPQMIINTLILLNMRPDLVKGLRNLYGLKTE